MYYQLPLSGYPVGVKGEALCWNAVIVPPSWVITCGQNFMVLEKENLQAANVKEIIAQTVAVLIMRGIVLFITIASIQYGNAFKPDDGMMPGMIKFALKGKDCREALLILDRVQQRILAEKTESLGGNVNRLATLFLRSGSCIEAVQSAIIYPKGVGECLHPPLFTMEGERHEK